MPSCVEQALRFSLPSVTCCCSSKQEGGNCDFCQKSLVERNGVADGATLVSSFPQPTKETIAASLLPKLTAPVDPGVCVLGSGNGRVCYEEVPRSTQKEGIIMLAGRVNPWPSELRFSHTFVSPFPPLVASLSAPKKSVQVLCSLIAPIMEMSVRSYQVLPKQFVIVGLKSSKTTNFNRKFRFSSLDPYSPTNKVYKPPCKPPFHLRP